MKIKENWKKWLEDETLAKKYPRKMLPQWTGESINFPKYAPDARGVATKMLAAIQKVEQDSEGPVTVSFDYEEDWDEITARFCGTRSETDYEWCCRVADIEDSARRTEEAERKQYEKLKKKYEKEQR